MDRAVITYTDYDAPNGDYAVVDGNLVPVSHDVLHALAVNASQLAGAMHTSSAHVTVPAAVARMRRSGRRSVA